MDEITDQNQPVSHPGSLTCPSRTRTGQRAGAGQAIGAKAKLVTCHVSGPASPRGPVGPGAARASRHCSLGPAHRATAGVLRNPAVAVLMAAPALPAGDVMGRGGQNPGWIQSRGSGRTGCDLLPPNAARPWPGCVTYWRMRHAGRRAAGTDGCWTATPKPDSPERAPKAASPEWPRTCAAARPAITTTRVCWPPQQGCAPGPPARGTMRGRRLMAAAVALAPPHGLGTIKDHRWCAGGDGRI